MKRIQEADVLVYDELAGTELLAFGRADAERIYVGKRMGRHSWGQQEISALLVALAVQGKRVVRLKGGDPLIFGRAGEEMAELAAAGISFEVVPGVTAAAAAGAAAGIPLTHRDFASGLVFLTGHERADALHPTTDWAALVRTGMTLCVYMGVRNLNRIALSLAEAGMANSMPVALISSASLAEQSTLLLTLSELIRGEHGEVPTPALAIIGEVARFPTLIAELYSSALYAGGSAPQPGPSEFR